MALFLCAIFLLPIFLTADLLQASLEAHQKKLAGEFFAGQATRLSASKVAMITELNRPIELILRLASDTRLAATEERRFQEVASEAFSHSFTRGIALLGTQGKTFFATGAISLETCHGLMKHSEESFLMCSSGYGVRTAQASSSPYLWLALDTQGERMVGMKKWAEAMVADPSGTLLTIARGPSQEWKFLPLAGGVVDPASFVPPIELPAGFDPDKPEQRSRLLPTPKGPMGLFVESVAPGTYFALVSSARSVADQYRAFLGRTIVKILVSIVYVVGLGILFASLVGVPVRKLDEACDQIEAGNYQIEAPPSLFAELDRFGRTFERMAERVGTRIDAANQELMEQHSRLKALFEGVGDAIFLLDDQFRVVLGNAPARKKLGCTEIPLSGIPLDDTRRALVEKLRQHEEPTAAHFQEPLENTWNKLSISRLMDYSRHVFGYVMVERDVTLEREIERMKNDLVSNVSHELRTPLTSIQAYAEMLVDGDVDSPEKEKEYLGIILAETERLTRLINDVLDLSRIESGRQVVRKVPISLRELVMRATRIMEQWATKKQLEWVVRISETEKPVAADRDMIEQAILNLLSNAIKYTPAPGTVETVLAWSESEAILRISDTGIGMSAGEREKLFSKFFRSDHETVKKAGGTGLGLVLTGEIVRLHDGKMTVTSEPGRGSVFEVRLPVQVPEEDS